MSSYEKVRTSKLSFKGGETISTKKRKKKSKQANEEEEAAEKVESAENDEQKATKGKSESTDIDDGAGYAPDGSKRSKKYEELFPVETKRFGYVAPSKLQTREEAVIERSKKKADRYCK